MTSEPQLKKEIVHFSHKLYAKGFVANHDGNISVRVQNKLWATPTAQSKGDVSEEMLVGVDLSGKKISGSHAVFSEMDLHVACYRLRPDISVVIHAHPPVTTAFAASHQRLSPIFIAEAIVTLGDQIPLVPFISPGCENTEKILKPFLEHADALLLENHGVLVVGKTLAQTYYRLELMEHLAQIEWHAKTVGGIKPLSPEIVQQQLIKRQKSGLGSLSAPISSKSAPSAVTMKENASQLDSYLKSIVEEELSKILR